MLRGKVTPPRLNPAPVNVMPPAGMVAALCPEFVAVTVNVLLPPTPTVPNDRDVGATFSETPVLVTPVPVSGTVVCGVGALLVTVTVPELDPVEVGLKVTLRGMLPLDAIVNGVAGALAMLKPGPETESPEMETLVDPLFNRVTVIELVVPTATLPKAPVEGEAPTATVGGALLTDTLGGPPAAPPQPIIRDRTAAQLMIPQNA